MKNQVEQTAKIYNEISDSYAAKFKKPSDNIDDFLKLVKKGGTVLDVGCGPGVDTNYIISKGYSATGVDLSEKMIKIARKKNPRAIFKKSDMRKLDFKPNSFDGILASFSLIHIPKKDIKKTVSSFYKFLKPEGIIYIGIQEGKSQEIFLTEPLKPNEKVFLNIISAEEIEKVLTKTGFIILDKFSRPAENKEEFNFNKFVVIARKK